MQACLKVWKSGGASSKGRGQKSGGRSKDGAEIWGGGRTPLLPPRLRHAWYVVRFDTWLCISSYFLHFQQRAEGGYNNRY